MSNFIYYEKLEDYEEQVKKAKLCDEKDKEIEKLNNIIEKIREYVYKPTDKEWDDILCIIEDGLRGSDK